MWKEYRFLHSSGVIFCTIFTESGMHSVLAVKLYLFNWKRSGQIIIFTAWKEPKRTTYSIYKTGWQIGEKTALENLGMHFTSGALLVSYLAETSHWVFSATESGTLLSGLSPCPTLKMHYQKFSSTFRPPTGLKIGTRGKTALENLIVNFTGKAYGSSWLGWNEFHYTLVPPETGH